MLTATATNPLPAAIITRPASCVQSKERSLPEARGGKQICAPDHQWRSYRTCGQIVALISDYIQKERRQGLQEVAGKLARIGRWELEDYTPELVSLAGTVFPTNLDPPQW